MITNIENAEKEDEKASLIGDNLHASIVNINASTSSGNQSRSSVAKIVYKLMKRFRTNLLTPGYKKSKSEETDLNSSVDDDNLVPIKKSNSISVSGKLNKDLSQKVIN